MEGIVYEEVDYKIICICHKGDIVVTQDYGVAAMALGKGAYAIHQSGKWYTNDNIDQMLMERHLKIEVTKMYYKNIVKGRFYDRPNRFIANVWVGDKLETVHVKNTGRCKELLLPHSEVVLEVSDKPERKTKYDLIAVYKEGFGLVNIDSQAPNKVVYEWLLKQDYTYIKPEYTYGNSRIDFYMEKGEEKYLMEVKGCTLEVDKIGYFPDAPTIRGVKHMLELIKAREEGYHCIIAFVIQMEGIHEVRANVTTHKEFGEVWEKAEKAGVEFLFLECKVSENSLHIK